MSWQGYADLDGQNPGYVRVTLGQFGPNEAILAEFPTPTLRRVDRTPDTRTESSQPLQLPVDLAETLYKALDRIFGDHHEEGVTDVLREVLKKEQARVDFALQRGPIVLSGEPVASTSLD